MVQRRARVLVLALVAVAATAASQDCCVVWPDAAVRVRVPGPLGVGRRAPVFVRVRNLGMVPVRITGVDLVARRAGGEAAGSIESGGRVPRWLGPGRAARVRFFWVPADAQPAQAGPVLFFACVTIQQEDRDPTNDCDVALGAPRGRAETLLLADHFDTPHPHWEWWQSGTGGHELANGLAAFTITEASHAGEYSDAEINDYTRGPDGGFPWAPGIRVEVRARSSDDNSAFSDEGRGTRGFGFWNLDTGAMTNVWFISLSKETAGGVHGLFAATVFVAGGARLFQPLRVDLTEWHTYGIVWTEHGVTFTVDGRFVAATPYAPAERLGLVAWIDNYRLSFGPDGIETDFLDLERDQSLFVDELRIWSLAP